MACAASAFIFSISSGVAFAIGQAHDLLADGSLSDEKNVGEVDRHRASPPVENGASGSGELPSGP